MNFEAVDKYGLSLSVATINTSDYAKSLGKSWEQMTQAEKAQAILSTTIAQSSSYTGLAQQESSGFTMQLQQMKQRLLEASAAIGEKLFPVLEPLISKIIEATKSLSEWVNEHPKLTQGVLMVVGVIGVLMAVGGPLLMMFASLSIISLAVGVGMLPLIGIIAGVTAVIIGLVAGGVALWQNWDIIKAKASEIWNNVKETISKGVTQAKEDVVREWNTIKTTTTNVFNTVKTFVTNTWNNIKTSISNAIEGAKTNVSNVVNGIKTTVSNAFNSVKTTVTNIWNGIKTAISNPINAAKTTIQNAMDAIKRAVNVVLKPNLKLPHISVSGKFSLDPPSVPKIGVQWYAKGGIMTSPTMFGMNGANAMVGGEAGAEAILPLNGFYKHLDNKLNELKQDNKTVALNLNIENFNNNTDKDIEYFANELAFYLKRKNIALGGV